MTGKHMRRVPARRSSWAVASLVCVGVCAGGAAVAQPASPAPDAWEQMGDADPLELADLAARVGDDAVLQHLSPGNPVRQRLAAVAACGFLQAPELALPALAAISAGRDPDLAPLAARQALAIAQRLAQAGLATREILPASLAPARAALGAVASSALVRSDLRVAAAQAAHLLGTLGVPGN